MISDIKIVLKDNIRSYEHEEIKQNFMQNENNNEAINVYPLCQRETYRKHKMQITLFFKTFHY